MRTGQMRIRKTSLWLERTPEKAQKISDLEAIITPLGRDASSHQDAY